MLRAVWQKASSNISAASPLLPNNAMKKTEEQRALEVLHEMKTPRAGINNSTPSSSSSQTSMENQQGQSRFAFLTLALRALGIIYGDIGTSPLYVIKSIFSGNTSPPSPSEIVGACSCIIWSLILLGSLKYVGCILRADNKGDGGSFALGGLLIGEKIGALYKHIVALLCICGAAMLIGDGALTPAVSVLSAIEGLSAVLSEWVVVPLTVLILIALFSCQRFGTSAVGGLFGPVMLMWLSVLALLGAFHISSNWSVLAALNPLAALGFVFGGQGHLGFYRIGAVFLCVTGLEALYADLGHFGRDAISISWNFLVCPALILNYLGQSALLLRAPELFRDPFFGSVPSNLYWPMIFLSTIATVVASQAMITGCFSLVHQAIALGFCPPVAVYHTSKTIKGQIYVPVINYFLMALSVAITAGLRSSAAISKAYGVTVCTEMIITTGLFMAVMRICWRRPWLQVGLFGLFFVVDGFFWSSNLIKITHGGWIAVLISFWIFVFMFSWYVASAHVFRVYSLFTRWFPFLRASSSSDRQELPI